MTRAERRDRADRYKRKSARDFRNVTGHDASALSTTRHALDCGRPGCSCKGERYGKRDRVAAKRELVAIVEPLRVSNDPLLIA